MTDQSPYQNAPAIEILSLGKTTQYIDQYTPSLLQAVPRQLNRDELRLSETLPFQGCDIWNLYELSWLDCRGKPVVAVGRVSVPANSTHIIESKSFKLYLNSFNQSRFDSFDHVSRTIAKDLSQCADGQVNVSLESVHNTANLAITSLPGESIDEQAISIDNYQFNRELLYGAVHDDQYVEETLYSNLLKSNCLVTNQPDWGSVMIRYHGQKIDKESLLRYLISFRQHNEFHEQCVERIFMDLMAFCQPEKLTVYARYTRRGGLDINPFRSNFEQPLPNWRLIRQ